MAGVYVRLERGKVSHVCSTCGRLHSYGEGYYIRILEGAEETDKSYIVAEEGGYCKCLRCSHTSLVPFVWQLADGLMAQDECGILLENARRSNSIDWLGVVPIGRQTMSFSHVEIADASPVEISREVIQ